MNNDDEKFFEELVSERRSADADFSARSGSFPEGKIELVRASAGVVAKKPRLEVSDPPKSIASASEPEGQLTIDVYQTPTDIIVESAIAGVRPEDIDINVTADSITIRGERYREKEASDEDYFYQECYWGRFSRSVILPQEVDPENSSVSFKNGILKVRLPKLNRKKEKKLKVKVE
ncbi:MAG: Hsp20/alpha crystallin family protein [bacterium]|nr:Hsp20/alpha crystallin family protein [bacterium]